MKFKYRLLVLAQIVVASFILYYILGIYALISSLLVGVLYLLIGGKIRV
jgi:hypothetical protein